MAPHADRPPGPDWYDEARVYDVLFSWDPATERDFVLGASARHGRGAPAAVLEPFCGTGRLLRVMPGLAVGFDRSAAMVRFARRTCPGAFQADAAAPPLADERFDLAYCLIDSFRHLLSEEAARRHLDGVARALRPGGVHVLGLDVSGGLDQAGSTETWSRERGGLRVQGDVSCVGDADPVRRLETMRVVLTIAEGKQRRTVESRAPLRTYTAAQLRSLVASVRPALEVVATFDRRYDLSCPKPLEAIDGSAVLVLRRA